MARRKKVDFWKIKAPISRRRRMRGGDHGDAAALGESALYLRIRARAW